jgi:hypothetical protein
MGEETIVGIVEKLASTFTRFDVELLCVGAQK